MMGRGKREALSIFPLLLCLLGYPAERPRFEKRIRASRKLEGGGGSAEAIISLVHGIVLWRGHCSFLEPAARAKAEPRSNERTMGKGARNRRLRKRFLFLLPLVNLLYYVIW